MQRRFVVVFSLSPGGEVWGKKTPFCCNKKFFVTLQSLRYWDQQEVKLQELPEDVPLGDMPRHVTVLFNREMVDGLQPGNRCTLFGVPVCVDTANASSAQNVSTAVCSASAPAPAAPSAA